MQTTTMTHEHYHPHHIEAHTPCHKACSVNWSAVIGGAIGATVVSLLLLLLGAGLGFANMSPWYNTNVDAKAVTVMTIIWLVVMQWLSAALGGYLTGRLRKLGTVIIRMKVSSAILPWLFGLGDCNLVRGDGVSGAASNMARDKAILERGHGHEYRHVDADLDGDTDAVVAPNGKTTVTDRDAVNDARKAAAHFTLWMFVAMLCGAFVASAAAALGGIHRDEHDLMVEDDFKPGQPLPTVR